MNTDIKITIIVPAYNVSRWISRCLDSICNQTYKNLEIIVIDDGSTDDTGRIIDEYAQKDQRVKAIHQDNTGLVEVRERGIKQASGTYLGFVDGDDEIELDMYERLLENALKYNADISQCGILYCFYDGRKKPMHGTGKLHIYNTEQGFVELMQGVSMEPSLCNKLYSTDLLYNSCLDSTILNNEDMLRNAVLFQRAKKTVFEDFCGYYYWRRAESMSNSKKNTVKIGKNILKARKLIMNMTTGELWKYAMSSYVNVLCSTYNSLIGNSKEDAKILQKECRNELIEYRKYKRELNKKLRIRRFGICVFPKIYNRLYKVHLKKIYSNIAKDVKKNLGV